MWFETSAADRDKFVQQLIEISLDVTRNAAHNLYIESRNRTNEMQITNSRSIGFAHGHEMFAWDEVEADGTVRSFEEYPATCPLPSLGRVLGLTLVRETTAA